MRTRMLQAITHTGSLEYRPVLDMRAHIGNSIAAGIGLGVLSIGGGILNGDPFITNHAVGWACIGFGSVMWGKSTLDTLWEYVEQFVRKPEPVQVQHMAESVESRNARNLMIALIEASIKVSGPDATKVPSDDKLGKPWTFRNRGAAVRYFGKHLKVVDGGKDRGTYVVDGTLSSILSAVREKKITPLLTPVVSN